MKFIEVTEPGDADKLRVAEREAPTPKSHEVLIEVHAAGVNRPDILQRQGAYPPPEGASDILGLEVAGKIVQLGTGVKGLQVGDEVCALTNGGGYAEFVAAPAGQCLPVPSNLTMVEAASLPETFFTVYSNLIERGGLGENQTTLIHGGTSGIGVTAIQIGRALGARVFTTAGSDEKCKACEAIGAEVAINYRTEDFVERLKTVTKGKGVDVILDMVGGDYIAKNIKIAAVEGKIVSIAFQKGFKAEVNFAPIMMKRLTYTGSTLRPQSDLAKGKIAEALKARIWPLLDAGQIKPVVHSVFAMDRVEDAHRLMESGEHVGKIVLKRE